MEDRTLERLARKLGAAGFAVERGGQLGQTTLAWRAVRDGSGLTGSELQVIAATADALGGGRGQPLQPVPAALFVQAVADALTPSSPGWRGLLLGARPLVVPLIFCPEGLSPRTPAHIQHSLREPEGAVVIPVLVGPDAVIEVLSPRSLLAGDPRDFLSQVRAALKAEARPADS